MGLLIRNACTEQWRLQELEEILDSVEDNIATAIQEKQIKTGNDYCNIVLRSAGKAIVSMREILCLEQPAQKQSAKQKGHKKGVG